MEKLMFFHVTFPICKMNQVHHTYPGKLQEAMMHLDHSVLTYLLEAFPGF